MATPLVSTVTVDGNAFDALSSSVVFSTPSTGSGVSQMGALSTSVRVVVDLQASNLPFGTLQSLFNLANVVTLDKIKAMKIDFWKDDSKTDVTCSYQFQGWISRFETTNSSNNSSGSANNLLVLDLQPVINKALFQDIQITN